MKLFIITSCTGEKAHSPAKALTLEDFQNGTISVKHREQQLEEFLMPAGQLYTGDQHLRLMRGIAASRSSFTLDLWILSAGYGLIPESRTVAPYECTFAEMGAKEIRTWADALHVPQDFRSLVSGCAPLRAFASSRENNSPSAPSTSPRDNSPPYDLALILLGDDYLRACNLGSDVKFAGPTILFCGQSAAKTIPRLPNLRVVALSNPEAKRFSCGLVGLKGELAARLLKKVAVESDALLHLKDPAFDVLAWLDSPPASSVASCGTSTRKASRANPNVDHVIQLPKSWWNKPHRQKLRYFIPEWDDLVDPDYDFLNDEHSSGSGDWSNNVFAHQMYPEPNYDGLLMSRAVAEKGKRKKERINALGVHRFLRVPREFPIMGDCGAFDYIMEEKPPYTTEDVLDYYTRLDFDYGVSVDHLIVSATEHQKKFRYELTIHNAERFLKEHRKAGLKWEPIGAVQGWDPESYSKAAAQYVRMGYRYIALGGLVRTPSSEILRTLRKVNKVVPKGVGLHLFGLARLKVILQMADLGVTSVDSASALRRAWLGGKDNYWTETGTHYRAVRIPEAGKSFRAKRMVSERRADSAFVEEVEKRLMRLMRAYDQGKEKLDLVLNGLAEYDHLITPDRKSELDEYRRTLEDKPWKHCSCDICQRDGIEVVIFRGNNRNRRRGFHNTYVFYRLLQKVLSGEPLPQNVLDSGQLELLPDTEPC